MRAKLAILVSLAGFASPLLSDEIQWRSASPRTAGPDAQQSAAAGGSSARAVSLARPVALPEDPGVTPVSFTPVAFKPVPVARTREEVRYASPLPEGPVIAGAPQNTAQGNGTKSKAQNGKPAPKDTLEPIEEVPTAPTPLPPSADGSGLIVPLDSGMVMGDGYGGGTGAYPFFLGGVGPRNFVYGSAELLLWNVSRANVTPLLSTGNLSNLNTAILYGNNQLANPGTAGGRFAFGMWCPFYPDVAVEVVGTFLGSNTTSFGASGNLSVPYLNASAGNASSTLSLTNGSFAATSTSEFWGIEANARLKWYEGPIFWLDCILGYRNLTLNESLSIYNQSTGSPDLGTVRTLDQFSTTNSFNAVQAGLEMNWNFLRYFTLGAHAKFGAGAVSQTLAISGLNSLPSPAAAGGLHALSSNIGTYRTTEFAVMPDIGVKLGWNPTDNIKLFVGYELLYLSNVMRAGEQIDARINPGLLPTRGTAVQPRAPQALLSQNDFWAHGVTFGAIFSW